MRADHLSLPSSLALEAVVKQNRRAKPIEESCSVPRESALHLAAFWIVRIRARPLCGKGPKVLRDECLDFHVPIHNKAQGRKLAWAVGNDTVQSVVLVLKTFCLPSRESSPDP